MKVFRYIIIAFYSLGGFILSSCLISLDAMNLKEIENNKVQIVVNYSSDSIYRGKIEIIIKNISEQGIEVSSPKCWVNCIPFLSNLNGKNISSVKIKPNPKCLEEFILVAPKGTHKVFYNYSLADIYPNITSGAYNIYFSYQGEMRDIAGNKFKTVGSVSKQTEIYIETKSRH